MAEPLSFFGRNKGEILLFLLDSFEKQHTENSAWHSVVLKEQEDFLQNCNESPEKIFELDGIWASDADAVAIRSVLELTENAEEVGQCIQGTLDAIKAERVTAERSLTALKNLLRLTKDALDNNNQADILVLALESHQRQSYRHIKMLEETPDSEFGGRVLDHLIVEQANLELLKMLIHLLKNLP